jgi:hypothetical protein
MLYPAPGWAIIEALSKPETGSKTMVARIVHIGSDSCHRLPVLKSAGYSIDNCSSVAQLHAALQARDEADAVVLTESDGAVPEDAVSLARSSSTAPLILFPSRNVHYDESDFDLVVPVLTPPEQWLDDIATLIERCRDIRMRSQCLREQSTQLRHESAALARKSWHERDRSRNERAGRAEFRIGGSQESASDKDPASNAN